ncbi:uncharacterized protein [Nicotiana tomentosiformis]|uniref:uncharacterized protein n=1 Tax=Nicotiana tomentosiformis TaxID=4098 RepID=UPI0008783A75|nr:uncharacterized protein LOC108944119 [Nicotiana tomentosiformis]
MEDRIGGNPVTWAEVADFNNCMRECGFLELPYHRSKYTWNDRHCGQRIYSKIDWTFNNGEWLDLMPSCKPEGISDHCPIKITLSDDVPRVKRSFKYYNAWAQHSQFNQIVADLWRTPIEGCRIFQIVKKLKLLKRKLSELNSQYFCNIEQTAKVDRQALKQMHEMLQTGPSNPDLQQEEHEKYQKFRESSYLDEMLLQQKSKATWLRLGDDNTGYFYSIIRHKRLKLATIQLKDDKGGMSDRTWSNCRSVPELLSRVAWPIEEREVKKTLFQIDNNKSPGPDGYSSGFFKASWHILGSDITEAILDFFRNGRLLKQIFH